MSRPKPKILLEAVHKDTYKADQILAAEAIYSCFIQGKPINLRTLNKLVSYLTPSIKKCPLVIVDMSLILQKN